MHPLSLSILAIGALAGVQVQPAVAETFEDRWPIIPKANAEPSPPIPEPSQDADQNVEPEPNAQAQSPGGAEPTRGSRDGPATRTYKRAFSGKASYYSYGAGKTASGSPYNRDALTAAHRSLPFGTRVRVIDPATSKSVVVVITDRGPKLPGRVLDLSLGAARTLGITDRGVVHLRAEVL